jgi:serine/threonine-protein kinase
MTYASGTHLGSYEVLALLGLGGMGEVYRALDKKLGREVALKVLPDAFAKDSDRLTRFDREARILASLNHPNIAAIYGLEQFGDVHILVLELVPGETLAQKISTGPLAPKQALLYARQIAEALEAAHEKGIIHRDLKPANIKVTPEERIKVLDFGLAKGLEFTTFSPDLSDSPTITPDRTEAGTILGTPAYMSPEQARGKPLDRRSDLWSFGCCLFEMLSGRRPFEGETFSDKVAAILSREPDWNALPAETPAPISQLIQRCLQKDASHRPSDFADVRATIDEAISDSTAKPHVTTPKVTSSRRTRVFIAAFAGALVLVIVGLVLRPQFMIRGAIPQQKYLAVFPFRDLSGQPANQLLASGLAETVSARLTEIPEIQVMPPSATGELPGSDSDLSRIAQTLGANLILQGTLQRSGDRIRVTYSLINTRQKVQIAADTVTGSKEDLFAVQDRLADSVVSALRLRFQAKFNPALRSGLQSAAADDRYFIALGYLQRFENESSVDNAIAMLISLSGAGSESALVQAALGRAYLAKYDLTHQPEWADSAVAACDRAVKLGGEFAEVHVTLGQLRIDTGHASKALNEFQRALGIQLNSADATLGLADAYTQLGKLNEAERTYWRAIELRPESWSGYNKLGKFYVEHGRFSQALEMFHKVIQLNPDNARGYYNLGVALQLMNRPEEARAAYQKSIALRPTADACSNLGTLEFSLGRYKEAADSYEKAVALSPQKSTYWANLGDAYRWAPGLSKKAQFAYERAIQLAQSEIRVNPQDAFVHVTLALCFAKLGEIGEAQKHIRRAMALDPKNIETIYQAAVVAVLSGKPNEALEWIRKAVEGGYSAAVIGRDPEFTTLRKVKAFQEVLTVPKTATSTNK